MTKPILFALPSTKKESEAPKARAFYRELECDVLARTLWGEARGEGTQGMQGVANVIMNRVAESEKRGTKWWGGNVIQVCQKPYQFSCWNRSDPNFKTLQAVDETDLYYATAVRVARRALVKALEDITGGATHYHAQDILPFWARGETATAKIGNHIFYRITEG